VYEAKDGGFVAVGAIEPQFYAELIKGMGLDPAKLPNQMDRTAWPDMKRLFAEVFKSKARDEWARIFHGTEACAVPVLSPAEAAECEHSKARGSFRETAGVLHPAAAPRFSRTALEPPRDPPCRGDQSEAVLAEFGFEPEEIAALRRSNALT
jgi:alpha-methylacyl-CoA racemase